MKKISIDEVESVLLQHSVPDTEKIIDDLKRILEELKADKDGAEDKPSYEYIVVLNDPHHRLTADAKSEITAYVVQQIEGADPSTIFQKMRDSANEQNESTKTGKLHLFKLKEIFEKLKPKYLKDKKIKIKTKEPVWVIINND
jgi:hypothetical protein